LQCKQRVGQLAWNQSDVEMTLEWLLFLQRETKSTGKVSKRQRSAHYASRISSKHSTLPFSLWHGDEWLITHVLHFRRRDLVFQWTYTSKLSISFRHLFTPLFLPSASPLLPPNFYSGSLSLSLEISLARSRRVLTLHWASCALIISYLPSAACSVGAVLMTSIKSRLSRFTPFLIRSPVSLAMRVPFLFLSLATEEGACSRCRL
jgi:hypothetical protein